MLLITITIDRNTGRVWSYEALDPNSISRDSRTQEVLEERFPISGNYQVDFVRLVAACRVLSRGSSISAIAISVAGKVSPDRTMIIGTGRLTGWIRELVAEHLAQVFDCPVILENDAVSGALAEAYFGRGPGYSFLYILWQDGIGACHILRVNGQSYPIPSEMGHLLIGASSQEGTPQCGCNRHGCLESLAGGWSLRRFGPTLSHVAPDQWDEVAGHMTRGIYNSLLDVQASRVILAGSIPAAVPGLVTKIRSNLQGRDGLIPSPVIVSASQFGEADRHLGPLALFGRCSENE